MSRAQLGLKFLAAAVTESVDDFVRHGAIEHLFLGHEIDAYQYVREHAHTHGRLPQPETISRHTQLELPSSEEPASYYLKHMRARYVDRGLRDALTVANEYMKPGPSQDPDAALNALLSELSSVQQNGHASELHDFRKALTPVMASYNQTYLGTSPGILVGWPYLDDMMGGVQPGDLLSFVGRPSKGKSWMLLYAAHHAWDKSGKTPMFVTMEMPALHIFKRLAAMHAHVPGMRLKLAELSDRHRKGLVQSLKLLSSAEKPFWVLDGGLGLRLDDIRQYAQQVNPDVIYVDGAYMIDNDDPRMSVSWKIHAACKGLKMLARELPVPVIASWQFRRDNNRSRTAEATPQSLDDVYGTDAVAQFSSVAVGMFQPNTVESLHRKLMQVLKGREGEVGEFWVNWDFEGMDFSEVEVLGEEGAGELPYV